MSTTSLQAVGLDGRAFLSKTPLAYFDVSQYLPVWEVSQLEDEMMQALVKKDSNSMAKGDIWS